MRISLPKIYPITDRELSGLSHTDQVRQFIEGGATLVQLRDKSASSRDFLQDALAAVEFARARGVVILINDRVDVAMIAGADGAHLGQDDLPAAEARKLLGDAAIIGVSTHTLDQARKTADAGIADYIAFGPIFETNTKTDHEPAVGLDLLAEIRVVIGRLPLVAIGGIKAQDLSAIFSAGADSAAMISEFYRENKGASQRFRELAEQVRQANAV